MTDLVFNGACGRTPDEDSIEYAVLAACCTRRAWPYMALVAQRGDFERAIDALRELGWGFEWVTLQ